MTRKPFDTEKSTVPHASASESSLISDIGSTASKLLSTISQGRKNRKKTDGELATPLVEQALDAASEVENFLTEQSARIAYLENLTLTDELTGLFNRRGFNEQVRRTLASASRYGDDGVLVICDLDNFKEINDTYGHLVGDIVLRHVAKAIEAQVRETDLVSRLGGDEFAVLMVQTNWRDGLKRAQMLNRVINRTIVTYDGHEITVSGSLGVEPFGPADEETNLIARADMAMYVNKRKKASIALNTAAE
ncbi:MAG: GGDEF domain-containing protein [Rhodospirillales bacterium]|jgi:diguanylate cyclase (GGDEF)-like protein|nr:GGDEF domain-containing protein [Rhodospirillales bacterium]MBT4007498.1 GGDEF domain-containing protein [Rhodospirillales bacterium]MBT5075706.1 GGDEF domain-containing protein [Rhodospirillales bacterium]MBT5113212.1 GGDEF domain-containing protein [Rhodospirillales bacterium]MBT5671845.1 GGDEF domain-containing protein [Rhodospirillales bacterium]